MNKKLSGYLFITFLLAFIVAGVFILRSRSDNQKSVPKPAQASKKKEPVKPQPQIDPLIYSLNLNKVFGSQDLKNINPNELVTIKMTGDIIPARNTNYLVVNSGNFDGPYLKTASWLKDADLTLTNLEAVQIKNCPPTRAGMSFCGDYRNIQGMRYAGIDVASLANNHTLNKGAAAFAEAQANLKSAGIEPVTEENAAYKTVKGTKFAFLAYNDVVPGRFDLNKIRTDIKTAKKNADVVVVMPHWGKEYVRKPAVSPGIAPNDPKVVSHVMIDAGADIILGNHPHWYQGVEIYKNKLIAYAHGNFVFDQDWSEETMKGVVGEYIFYKGKLVAVDYKPIKIAGNYQPYFLAGAAASEILAIMKANSWENAK